MRLLLASASPRRRELLAAAGFAFDVEPAEIDERRRPDEEPAAYVERLARAKAHVVHERHPDRVVVAADTAVVLDAEVFGKPNDEADAASMLRRLAARDHEVLTGVAVGRDGRLDSVVERTRVWFAPIDEATIRWYIATGEPMDKAGAYAIQGLASRFVQRLEGSYSNVVGLPLAAVARLLARPGRSAPDV